MTIPKRQIRSIGEFLDFARKNYPGSTVSITDLPGQNEVYVVLMTNAGVFVFEQYLPF